MRTATLYNFLVEANLIAAIAILLLALVRRILRKQLGNRVLYFAWLLIAFRLLCPLALPNPAINEIRPGYLPDQAIRPIAGQIKVRFTDASDSINQMMSSQSGPLKQTLNAFVTSTYNGTFSRRLMVVYFCGAGAVLCYFVFANLRFRRRLTAGRIEPISGKLLEQYQALCRERNVKPIPVYYTDPLPSTCLVGVFRPYIALPLTAAKQEAISVLAHEVCHYKGKDHLLSTLRLLCCAVHWFNPLVWLAANMSRTDGELNCDDHVVEKLDQEDKLAYTNALVLAAAKRGAPGVAVLATGMTMTGKKLKNRVNGILHSGHVKKGLALSFTLLASIALIAAFATAEYKARPVMPVIAQGRTATTAAKNIQSDAEAIAYAQAFWQSDLMGFNESNAEWTVKFAYGAYEVRAISPAMKEPAVVSFLPNGVIVGFSLDNGWSTPHATVNLYDGDKAMQEEAGKYILAYAKAMLPGAADLIDGLCYTGEGKNGEYHFVSFVGINQYSVSAYHFELQVQPEVRMVNFYMDEEMRNQSQVDSSAMALPVSEGAIQLGGFSATDMSREDKLFTMPNSGDMSLESALSIALNAIYGKYKETELTMSRFRLEYGFRVEPAAFLEPNYWQFDFRNSDIQDRYEVMVHSPDGALLYIGGPDGSDM